MKSKKVKWTVIGISAALLVAWGVLMVVIFGGKDGTDNAVNKGTATPTPMPEGDVVVWCLTDRCETEADGSVSGTLYEYDELGRCVSAVRYVGSKEYRKDSRSYTYDTTTGLVTEEWQDTYDFEKPITYRFSYSYDCEGNIRRYAEMRLSDDGQFLLEYTKEVLDDGTSTDIYYDDTGKQDVFYQYDAYHNIIRGYSASDNEVLQRGERDSQGRVIKVYDVTSYGEELQKEIVFDEDGSRKETSYSEADSETIFMVEEYDAKGNRTFYQWYNEGEPTGSRWRTTVENGPAGETLWESQYDFSTGEEKLLVTYVTKTNPDGRYLYVSTIRYGATGEDGNLIPKETVQYREECDELGRTVKMIKDEIEGKCSYDQHGNISSVEWSNGSRMDFTYVPITIPAAKAAEKARFYDPITALPDYGYEVWLIQRYRQDIVLE